MARNRQYSPEERRTAMAFLEVLKGDIPAAARKANVEEAALRFWIEHPDALNEPVSVIPIELPTGRPMPPEAIADMGRYPILFEPAHEVLEWVKPVFLDEESDLYNEDHRHLRAARIGILWTNVANKRQMKVVGGQAEMPGGGTGGRWAKARGEYQLCQWYGSMPDFLITLDAVICAGLDDATWCALLDHELYHCGHARTLFDTPKYDRRGRPVYTMLGHDVEAFIGVTRRWGVGAAESGVAGLVDAAQRRPLIAQAQIDIACGNCLRRA